MMNVSSDRDGVGAGVLIRALEPLDGIALMRRRRRRIVLRDLTRGPGRTAAALAIDKRRDGVDLCGRGPLWLAAAVRRRGAIGVSRRIGLSRLLEWPLPLSHPGHPFLTSPHLPPP